MPRLKPHEKRELLVKRRDELDKQIKAVEAKHKEGERKRDTRRKVVAGAIALEQIARDPTGVFSLQFVELLGQFVEPRSRELFPFLPKKSEAEEIESKQGSAGKAA